jgi:hypothetical protein
MGCFCIRGLRPALFWRKISRGFAVDQLVERQNSAHYAEQLKTEPDPIKRVMLQQLLAEERVKQVSHAKVEK